MKASPSSLQRKKATSTMKQQSKILLVDDEPDIIHVLKRGLEINGFQVDAYSSSEEALNSFKPSMTLPS